MTQTEIQKWVEKQTHDDQSQQQGQNTKQQETTQSTRKQHKKITHFPWIEYCEDGVIRLDCFWLVSF